MPFQQLVIELGRLDAERVEDALLALGALSVTLCDAADQPILEPGPGERPLWRDITLTALLDAETEPAAVMAGLCAALALEHAPPWRVERVEDRDWERAWLDDFKPQRFGARLWVVPSAYEPPDPEAVNLILDPGLAFGTGTHPTTALCLAWLDGQELNGMHILDYGCGSGILAIAALKLGAARAVGVDNDPQALTAARDNAERNKVAGRLNLYLPDDAPAGPWPVVIANILANPLVALAPRLAEYTAPGGRIALSGILAEQESMILKAYASYFELEAAKTREEWLLITGTKRN